MSKRIVVHDSVYDKATEIAQDKGITKKEAIRDVFMEADYDV